jgi:hypothetical protein
VKDQPTVATGKPREIKDKRVRTDFMFDFFAIHYTEFRKIMRIPCFPSLWNHKAPFSRLRLCFLETKVFSES